MFPAWSSHRRLPLRLVRTCALAVAAVVALYYLAVRVAGPGSGPGPGPRLRGHARRLPRSRAAAGNRTLGFDSIQFVNLRNRYDRLDAVTLQAFLSGLDIVQSPGVEADDITDVGMPPAHQAALTAEEKGCYRAHANIWSMMLREKRPAVLILESDVTWDVRVREIMANFSEHFTTFLRRIHSAPLPNPSLSAALDDAPAADDVQHDPDDPWHSRHWDVLSLGHCFEMPQNNDVYLVFPDAHVPAGHQYWGLTLGNERVVRKSGGIACMTGYAVSQTGAAKLLLRSAIDLDAPIDIIMRRMILAGDLVTYSTFPTIMAQWQYSRDIGMDRRGADSDIRGRPKPADKDAQMQGWRDVWTSGSVWDPKWDHPDIAFEEMALQGAWRRIFGNASLTASLTDTDAKH